MKKIISYLVLALMVVTTTTSCDDFLKEEMLASSAQEGFLNDADNAEASLYSVYSSFIGTNLFGRWWPAYQSVMRSDDVALKTSNSTLSACVEGRMSSATTWIDSYNAWEAFWIALNRANYVIDGLENGSTIDEDDKLPLIGEAKALRAYIYFQLVRCWGDLPKIDFFSDQATADIVASLDRSPAEEIYADIIVPDLIYASEYAPDSQSMGGRVSKYFARTLLAEVYATMAGYRYDSITGATETFPASDTGKSYWELAREAAYSVIYDASCPFSLNTAHSGNGPAYAEAWDSEHTSESLFELDYICLSGYGNWLTRDYPCNKTGVTFWGANNVTSNPILYYESGRTNTTAYIGNTPFTGGSTVGLSLPTTDLFRCFEEGDERKWGILTRYNVDYNEGGAYATEDNTYFCQPQFRKYMDFDVLLSVTGTSFQYAESNIILYRYADAMLLFAEADNELNGPTADGIAQINALRNRAGLANLDATKTGDQASFRDAIRQERRVELHAEFKRHHDLIRWNTMFDEVMTMDMYYKPTDNPNPWKSAWWSDSLGIDTTIYYMTTDSVTYQHGALSGQPTYDQIANNRSLPVPYSQMQYSTHWNQNYGY